MLSTKEVIVKGPKQTDVIVVGAGPVGMMTALCLRRKNLKVQIFDTMPHSSTHSYGLALHGETLRQFREMGLLDRVRGSLHPLDEMVIHRGNRVLAGVKLKPPAGDPDIPPMAVAPQSALEQVLQEALAEAGVDIQWKHRISQVETAGRRVRAVASELEERTLGYAIGHTEQFVKKNHEYEAEFLIGADGHDSFVRRALDIDFPEVGPARRFAVFEFISGEVEDSAMRVVFDNRERTSLRWPLGKGAWRWSFEIPDRADPIGEEREKDPDLVQMVNDAPYPVLGDKRLEEFIRERAPWCSPSVERVYWRLLVRFEKRLVSRFGEGRIWLAGDAAHLTGPVGVHSMNVGMKEGCDLAARIADVLETRASADALAEYNRERMAEWRLLLGLDGKPAGVESAGLAGAEPHLISWLPASGEDLRALAGQFGVSM